MADSGPLDDDDLIKRLERRTRKEGECHIWTGARDGQGYGHLKWMGRSQGTHRLSWIATHGPIPVGLGVLHKCDVRACINPDHLWLGPPAANSADMVMKGRCRSRGPRGKENGNAKLTDDQVRAIRAAVGPQKAIGTQYGVDQTQISRIRRGATWRHVDG